MRGGGGESSLSLFFYLPRQSIEGGLWPNLAIVKLIQTTAPSTSVYCLYSTSTLTTINYHPALVVSSFAHIAPSIPYYTLPYRPVHCTEQYVLSLQSLQYPLYPLPGPTGIASQPTGSDDPASFSKKSTQQAH